MAENRVRFRADMDDRVSGKLDTIGAKFQKVSKSTGFKALAQGVGLGAGVAAYNLLGDAVSATIDFFGDAITAASNMTETLSKSRVVFGGAANDIERFGNTAAQALGISKRNAIEAAASFGNFFTNIGRTSREAADMSKRMVALAADLASFNNIGTDEALEKIRAGLAGEAEPLRQVGVFLTEAKVKAKAMELGLLDLNGELSEGAKILARYQLILDETTKAQGDFARTADGLANKQRQLDAKFEDTKARLGRGAQVIANQVVGAFVSLTDAVTALANQIEGDHRSFIELIDTNQRLGEVTEGSFRKMASAVGQYAARAQAMKKDHKELVSSLTDDARKLIDAFYDPIIARDELLANRAEANAAKRVLASAKATEAEKRDARAALHRIAKDNLELKVELLEAGELSASEQAKFLQDLQKKSQTAKGRTKRAIDEIIAKIKELAAIANSNFDVSVRAKIGTGPTSKPGLAHGGAAEPYTAYTVGEHGPETLVMGAQAGTVIPNGGMGGTQIIQLVVDGKVLAEVVDKHQYRALQRMAPTALRA